MTIPATTLKQSIKPKKHPQIYDRHTWKKTRKLLSSGIDAKTKKGEKLGVTTYILYGSPAKQNSKKVNLCPLASLGCVKACLFSSGRGGLFSSVEIARIEKTEFYLNDRAGFLDKLYREIKALVKRHKNNPKYTDMLPAIRLNGTTDIRWEKQKIHGKTLMNHFPDLQFYDYTPNYHRFAYDANIPANYHLTFSRKEDNEEMSLMLLDAGHNVAMVFDKLPATYKGFTVIDGDISDVRFLDPSDKGYIIGLTLKKSTKRGADNEAPYKTGFAIRYTGENM